MDFGDFTRKLRRVIYDGNFSSRRKIIIIIIIIFGLLLYLEPLIFRYFFSYRRETTDPSDRCLYDRLLRFKNDALQFDANINHLSFESEELPHIPFIGNGKLGLVLESNSLLYLKHGRVLSVPVPFHPVITVALDGASTRSASVVHYTTGVASTYSCFSKGEGYVVSHITSYIHRILPSIIVQEIKVTNPTNENVFVELKNGGYNEWRDVENSFVRLGSDSKEFKLITGKVPIKNLTNQFFAVAIVMSNVPNNLKIQATRTETLVILMSVHYAGPIAASDYHDAIEETVKMSKQDMNKALTLSHGKLKEDHINVWKGLWKSGFSISYSKAHNAVNGNNINATIYFLLSHSRSPLYEVDITKDRQQELMARLSDPDRCYEGHSTIQASTLWSHLSTVEDMQQVVALWKLTLTNKGCKAMLQAGADGILQAMMLSLGALKFNNHHLEFGMHPKELHRDYHFRRINYGNATHLNISVIVGEDNKASLFVALDRSDRDYYACDGGCLDTPVQLRPENQQFPVKLTDPPTAILYITSDRKHMEELKHTIHVKEIAEAPAHEHHIIALHRHGHHLGGLPTLFWVSIVFLLLVFHLFLFKLIYNEYCVSHDKVRERYAL